jgi:carbon-monoxide dehydrogenase medium subunit
MSFGSPYLTLPDFQYSKPSTLQEALDFLDAHKEETSIMAGGVGLLAFMKERLVEPRYVVDIKGIKELQTLDGSAAQGITIGAAVNMNRLLAFGPLKENYTALWECISLLSDPILRNRTTLMGDICEALPYVDGPTPLLVFDSEIETASVNGTRRIPISEFIKGPAETALEQNELAVAIHVKLPSSNSHSIFLKHTSKSEFSIANVAALCANPSTPNTRILRFAYGAVGTQAIKVDELERLFKQNVPVKQLIDEAVRVIKKDAEVVSDVLSREDYRLHMLGVLSFKALSTLLRSRDIW